MTDTAPARQVEQLRRGEVSRPTQSDREFRNLTPASGAAPVQPQARDANQTYTIRF